MSTPYEVPVTGGQNYPPPSAVVPPSPLPSAPPPGGPVLDPAFGAAPAAQDFPRSAPVYAPPAFAVPQEAPPAYVAAPLYDPTPAYEPSTAYEPPIVFAAPPPVVEQQAYWDSDNEKQAVLVGVDPSLVAALQEVLIAAASDLHISSNSPPMIRIDGTLRPINGSEVWDRGRVLKALTSILTLDQRAAFDEKLELDFAYTISANARFRVNFYQQRGAIGGAFRLIPTGIKQLEELGVPDVVARFAGLARGLVLVTGPTGSGKSTTLAALIDLVNRTRADHIVTVEDPIEFLHSNKKSLVNQREVGSDTHSFGNALKHVLRQDPDVILIGELRDLETISVALTAAETGHLVFATLHTQDAGQSIDRIIDVFPPHQQGQVRSQLAATLQGVVCQTLVKRASGSGRAVVTEVLVATPAISNLVREGKTYQIRSALQAGRELGMHTMDQHFAELVNTGQVTYGAAVEKVQDLEDFKRLVHRTSDNVDPGMSGFGGDFGSL